eukprot:874118-Amphidinium_carterae.1
MHISADEANLLKAIRSKYPAGVPPIPENIYDTTFVESVWSKWFFAKYTCSDTLQDNACEQCIKQRHDDGGFLTTEASSIEREIMQFLDTIRKKRPKQWRQLPVAIVAQEFRHWAVGTSAGVAGELRGLETPTPDAK